MMGGIELGDVMEGGRIRIGATTYDVEEIRTIDGIVWPYKTYMTIHDVRVLYSGDLGRIAPNGANYAYVVCNVNIHRGNKVIETRFDVHMTPHVYSDDFYVDEYGYIWGYHRGTVVGDALECEFYAEYEGMEEEDLVVRQGANVIERTEIDNVDITLLSPTEKIPCDDGGFEVSVYLDRSGTNHYSSGATDEFSDHLGEASVYIGDTFYGTVADVRNLQSPHPNYLYVDIGTWTHQLEDWEAVMEIYSDGFEADFPIVQSADELYEDYVEGSETIECNIQNDTISATGGYALITVVASHKSALYWKSDDELYSDDTVEDTWSYGADNETDFSFDVQSNSIRINHENMGKHEGTDYLEMTIFSSKGAYEDFEFSATNEKHDAERSSVRTLTPVFEDGEDMFSGFAGTYRIRYESYDTVGYDYDSGASEHYDMDMESWIHTNLQDEGKFREVYGRDDVEYVSGTGEVILVLGPNMSRYERDVIMYLDDEAVKVVKQNPGVMFSGIQISADFTEMEIGDTRQLEAYAMFSDGDSEEITDVCYWSSSDDSVIEIRGHTFVAVGSGSASIICEYEGVTESVEISVAEPEVDYSQFVRIQESFSNPYVNMYIYNDYRESLRVYYTYVLNGRTYNGSVVISGYDNEYIMRFNYQGDSFGGLDIDSVELA